ncbi:MAG: hypothetical protein WKG07_01220 [Hymenobacter sp.]
MLEGVESEASMHPSKILPQIVWSRHIYNTHRRIQHHLHGHQRLDSIGNEKPEERLGPDMIQHRYLYQDLGCDFAAFWELCQQRGLEKRQREALSRWNDLDVREMGKNIHDHELDLETFFLIFDDLFFLGALSKCTNVKWVDHAYGESKADQKANEEKRIEIRGTCGLRTASKLLWFPDKVEIEVVRLVMDPQQEWTRCSYR